MGKQVSSGQDTGTQPSRWGRSVGGSVVGASLYWSGRALPVSSSSWPPGVREPYPCGIDRPKRPLTPAGQSLYWRCIRATSRGSFLAFSRSGPTRPGCRGLPACGSRLTGGPIALVDTYLERASAGQPWASEGQRQADSCGLARRSRELEHVRTTVPKSVLVR